MGEQSKLSALFLLFIAISGNFLAPLFPCPIQELLTNSMIAKHLLGFATLFFSVVLNTYDGTESVFKIIGYSLMLYGWFVIMTRMDGIFFIPIVCVLCAAYLLSIYIDKRFEKVKQNDETTLISEDQFNIVKNILYYVAILITIVGFLLFYGQQKVNLGKEFSFKNFILGRPFCNFKHSSVPYADSLKALFDIRG